VLKKEMNTRVVCVTADYSQKIPDVSTLFLLFDGEVMFWQAVRGAP
jgi:hypothetical protein